MQCPACKADDDKVIDSRPSDDGAVVRRRRECNLCAKRFTTYERLERTARLVVVKRDGTCVPFEIENIMRGIQAACGKRPVPEAAKLHLAQEVDDELHLGSARAFGNEDAFDGLAGAQGFGDGMDSGKQLHESSMVTRASGRRQ